ncbi:MAG: response regulator transcription factor [Tissierellia bacterium]|nr:response regulator transcription factor [Tissierellia bacterium]
MHRIIVVEDDINIRELIVYALNNNGFKAMGVPGANELYQEMSVVKPSMLILDIMLDGESGYDILENVRKDTSLAEIPIIMLTAKSSEFDKVKGLDMGADDYITKPFGVMELISRVKALIRRVPSPDDTPSQIEYKDIYMDLKKREIYVSDELVELTYKEYELIYFFIVNSDIVLSRDKIMTEVWGYDYVGESRTVDVHIRTLRQKLGEAGKYIKTVRNIGYKLGE